MLSKNRIYIILLILVATIFYSSIFACGAEISWRLGGKHNVGTPETLMEEYFANFVNERTEGKMEIIVYPANQLGDEVTQVENLSMRIQDVFCDTISDMRALIPEYAIFTAAYAFADNDHIKRFYDSDVYMEMENRLLRDGGVRVLAKEMWRLPRVVLTKRPAATVEDLKGIIFRLAANKLSFAIWEAIGTSPIEIPWAETYSAVDSGLVDGLESPIDSIYGMGFHRVAPYILMTNHVLGPPFAIMVNEKSFQDLPEEIKIIVKEAAEKAENYYVELVFSDIDKMKEELISEGAVFTENVDTRKAAEMSSFAVRKLEKEGEWQEGLFDFILSLR